MAPMLDVVSPNIFPTGMALRTTDGTRRSLLSRFVVCPLCLVILGLDHAAEAVWRLRAGLGRFAGAGSKTRSGK